MRISDGSSDVCSSDLAPPVPSATRAGTAGRRAGRQAPATRSRARRDSVETITVGLCRVPTDKTKGYALSCAAYSAALRLRSVVSRHSRNALHSVIQRHHVRSEEHKSELQSLMRISYAVFCLQKKKQELK